MNTPTPTPATTKPRTAAKHTPGPWHAEGKSVISENGEMEASITTGKWQENNEESRANARLVAASPELLRELKKCVAAIQKWGKAHPESGGWTGLIHGGLAAIAQAEGGAQ